MCGQLIKTHEEEDFSWSLLTFSRSLLTYRDNDALLSLAAIIKTLEEDGFDGAEMRARLDYLCAVLEVDRSWQPGLVSDGQLRRMQLALKLMPPRSITCMSMYIYVYVCMYIHTHTHTYIYIYVHTHTHMYIYISERDGETERRRDRETERQRDRETENAVDPYNAYFPGAMDV